ncbi:MAG: MMPL family transporter [Bacteriovorax sp.]
MEDLGNQTLSSYQDMQSLKEDYAFEDKLTLIFKSKDALKTEDYCKIYNWLKKETNNNPDIQQVSSLFDLRYIKTNGETLFYPRVIDQPCEQKLSLQELQNHPYLNLFSAPNLNELVIHFKIRPSPVAFRHGIYDYEIIKKIIASAKTDLAYETLIGGTLFFQSSVLEGINKTKYVNLVAIILLVGTFYYLYRSVISSIIMVVFVFITNEIIKAGMATFNHAIDPLSSCIFLMITVAIIEDYVFLSYLVFKKEMKFMIAAKKILLPSFLTSLTTAIGFGSLAISSNPSVSHFGIWTALGAMFEWFLIFIILPLLYSSVPFIKKAFDKKGKLPELFKDKLSGFSPHKYFTYSLIAILISIFFIFDKANLNYSPYDMFENNHEINLFKKHLKETKNTEGEISLVFKDSTADMKPVLDKISKLTEVTKIISGDDLKSSLKSLPLDVQFLILDDFKRSALGKLFWAREHKRAMVYVNSYETTSIEKLEKKIDEICGKDCKAVSDIIVSKDYALGILKTLYDSFIFCFVLILIIVTVLVLGINRDYLLPVMLSTIWAPITLIITVIIFQFKINVVTCVALTTLVGLAGDNAIQFLLLKKTDLKNSVSDYGQASFQVFLLMMLLSICLVLSYYRSTKILSGLMIISIVLMSIGDIWILNGLLKTKSKS